MDILINWVEILGVVLLAAKSITVLTPSKSDDFYVNMALTIINKLALNVLKDKNADAG